MSENWTSSSAIAGRLCCQMG